MTVDAPPPSGENRPASGRAHWPGPQSPQPRTPVERWSRPFLRFLEVESASGVLLLACTVAALALANSAWADAFDHFWHTAVGFQWGEFTLIRPLEFWINDGLMTIFFFVVGLEIKREIIAGELRNPRKAALPIIAAAGGMLAPAVIYLAVLGANPGRSGWGVPVATDIAFVVGFLSLLGPRVPFGLKIMLLSLAIADDIGAIIVIAFFYSSDISFVALAWAGAGLALTYGLNWIGVRRVAVYVFVGAGIWYAFLQSGVHPTVAGVILGLLTPASAWIGDRALLDVLREALDFLGGDHEEQAEAAHGQGGRKQALGQLRATAQEGVSPLERLETGLHPWVAFVIMPLFALANAGVAVAASGTSNPVMAAVATGLVLGKPLGVVLASFVAVKLGLASLPAGVDWRAMIGAGCLAGIGFTMAIFIAELALEGANLEAGKLGVLVGSSISAVLGYLVLLVVLPKSGERSG